jgi:hypothetical protein
MLSTNRSLLLGAGFVLAAVMMGCCEAFGVPFESPHPLVGNTAKFASWVPLTNHLLAGAVSAVLLTTFPARVVASDAVSGTSLEAAIVQVSEAAYPVFRSIEDVSLLSSKLVSIVDKKIPVPKATEALDKGIDTFLAIPDDKVAKFASILQSSYEGVSNDNCKSLSGTGTAAAHFAAIPAVQGLDANKVKALQEKYASANKAVVQKSGDICLPPSSKGLEQVWIGQTELTLNMPKAESKAFVGSLTNAIKVVPTQEWLRLLPDAKKTFTSNVDAKLATKFEKAGKALEKAFQEDARIQKRLSAS